MNLDTYTFRARVAPVLLVLLPVLLATMAWFPDQLTTWRALPGAGVTAFLAVLLAQLGRDSGKAKEAALFESWGGKPTVQLLRHSYDGGSDTAELRRRQRIKLAKLSGMEFPTPEQEAGNPDEADSKYDAAVSYLIAQTRDTLRFRLIYAENVNYGFRRNLWGVRFVGAVAAGLGAGAAFTATYFAAAGNSQITAALLGVVNLLLFLLYVLRVNRQWVRLAAFEYAKQLLESVELLDQTDTHTSAARRIIVER
jgi:hypothetical protein